MGRIKSTLIKRTSKQLIESDPDLYDIKFEHNKKILKNSLPSKRLRNKVAGYISRLKKDNKKMNESRDNIIFVGGKPFMNYVTSVLLQFTKYEFKEVILKSRGKFISKAVDVAEVSKKKFLKQIKIEVKDVKIDSEDFETKEGKKINVSTIEIILEKKD